MITIKCDSCGDKFGISEHHLDGDRVVRWFQCPYCGDEYPVGNAVGIVGVTGGVNVNAGSFSVRGDIVGRDKRG